MGVEPRERLIDDLRAGRLTWDPEAARLRAMETWRKLSPQDQSALFFACGERRRKLYGSGAAQQAERTFRHMIELMPHARPEVGLAACFALRKFRLPETMAAIVSRMWCFAFSATAAGSGFVPASEM